MIQTSQLTGRGWVDLYAEFSIPVGTPLIVHNPNTTYLFLSTDVDPVTSGNYIRVEHNENARTSYTAQQVYVKGDGFVSVSVALSHDVTSGFHLVDLPHDLYTDSDPKFRRLRVDPGQTSFFRNTQYRTFHEFNIPTGNNATIKFEVPQDIILWNLTVELDGGSVRMLTVADLTSNPVTENTSFVNPIPVFRKNNMSSAPPNTGYVTATNGGSISGGLTIDLHRIVASNSSGQRTSIVGGSGANGERGVSPGTYYIKLESFGNSAATGVLSGWWEETPFQ